VFKVSGTEGFTRSNKVDNQILGHRFSQMSSDFLKHEKHDFHGKY